MKLPNSVRMNRLASSTSIYGDGHGRSPPPVACGWEWIGKQQLDRQQGPDLEEALLKCFFDFALAGLLAASIQHACSRNLHSAMKPQMRLHAESRLAP
jgi:hypothetical protein